MNAIGTPCECASPICGIIKDIVVSAIYQNRVMIHRYCDCIVHGTFMIRTEVNADRYVYTNHNNGKRQLTECLTYSPCHESKHVSVLSKRF